MRRLNFNMKEERTFNELRVKRVRLSLGFDFASDFETHCLVLFTSTTKSRPSAECARTSCRSAGAPRRKCAGRSTSCWRRSAGTLTAAVLLFSALLTQCFCRGFCAAWFGPSWSETCTSLWCSRADSTVRLLTTWAMPSTPERGRRQRCCLTMLIRTPAYGHHNDSIDVGSTGIYRGRPCPASRPCYTLRSSPAFGQLSTHGKLL